MNESKKNLILLKEKEYRWDVYQFLIDENGKKYIKFFSADSYWTENNGIFVAEFTEDSIPEQSKTLWEGYQKDFIDHLKEEFNNNDNWESNDADYNKPKLKKVGSKI